MLEIVPLRTLRYDPERAGDPGPLLAPPYDVIGADEQAALEARSPYNAVRLILPPGEGDARYARAAATLRAWVRDGVLRADPPALWRYDQTYPHGARERTRRALLCGVRVRPFEDRVVLPHERTHAAPKEDRYRLKMAARAHLSPFFALYDDADGAVARALDDVVEPAWQGRTPDGQRHRLARVSDGAASRVALAMRPRQLVIADGHHRYETMLRLAREIGTREAEVGLACLVRVQEEGLAVGPTHRLVRSVSFDAASFLERARTMFEHEARPVADPSEIEAIVASRRARAPAMALVVRGRDRVWYLSLRADADLGDLPAPLRRVEAALLERALASSGPGDATVGYTHEAAEALARVRAGAAAAAFLLGPATVDDVVRVAQAGLSMPQKSTFFYPKVPTGLVFHPF